MTTLAQDEARLDASPSGPGEIEARGVSVLFSGKVHALDDVSLALHRGDVLGIVGESGSGKTTLCRGMVGLQRATSGSVLFKGREIDLSARSAELAFRRRVQMLLQDAAA